MRAATVSRPVWAEVDLAHVRHNAALLADRVAPARLCAVVKAWGYGHGPVPVARAALEGGASWLAVALVEEGAQLRDAGIEAPILLLSEPPADAMADVVGLHLTPTVYTEGGVEAAAEAASARGSEGGPLLVHVKVDTGMHRVGASPAEAVKIALTVEAAAELRLEGLWTHFAVADDPSDPFTAEQCARLGHVLAELAGMGVRPALVHASNSAGALAHRVAHHDMVRCGIAVYGLAPGPALEGAADLRPALSLRARVSHVKQVAAGEGLSYGLRYRVGGPTLVATVPVGYADGVPWRLAEVGGEVLLGGRRRRIAGSVTMDQILLDCGDDRSVVPGEEVVLLGTDGGERIGAWDWAGRLGTIAYEVLCGIGPRVPRHYV